MVQKTGCSRAQWRMLPMRLSPCHLCPPCRAQGSVWFPWFCKCVCFLKAQCSPPEREALTKSFPLSLQCFHKWKIIYSTCEDHYTQIQPDGWNSVLATVRERSSLWEALESKAVSCPGTRKWGVSVRTCWPAPARSNMRLVNSGFNSSGRQYFCSPRAILIFNQFCSFTQ